MRGLDFLSIEVYAVDVPKLRATVSGRDEAIVAAAAKRSKVPPWNEYRVEVDESWLNPLIPAMQHLVQKTSISRDIEPRFIGHALRMLAAIQGKALPVSAWGSFTPSAVRDVDAALARLPSKLKLSTHLHSGAPVKLPAVLTPSTALKKLTVSSTPIVGFADADEVARTAPLLAEAVAAGTSQSPSADRCEMQRGTGKKAHTWVGTIVGTSVVQEWRAPSAKLERVVNQFKAAEFAHRNYESYIADRSGEGYVVTSRTEAPKARAKKQPAVDPKVLARIAEAHDWYVAAAKAKRGLVFFAY